MLPRLHKNRNVARQTPSACSESDDGEPPSRSARRRGRLALLALLIGGLVALAIAFWPAVGVAADPTTAVAAGGGGSSSLSIPVGLTLALLLVFLNGFFVAAEFALVKVRPTQLEAIANEGSKRAKMALKITHQLDEYLSATQLGITLASLGLGWLGEPAVARALDGVLQWMNLSMSPSTLSAVSFVIAFSTISYFHIVVGEVAPKSLALARPTKTTLFVAYPMYWTYWAFWPALKILNTSSNALLRLFGVEPVGGHSMAMTADELRNIAQHSRTDGTITDAQGDLLANVFTFSNRVAREIMIPRNQVVAVDASQSFEEVVEFVTAHPHTRFPLYRDELENVLGLIHLKDLAKVMAKGETTDLESLVREVIYVPETMPAQQVLREFQVARLHLALVVDEHGGVAGLITLEDTLEELVGEIRDEFDREDDAIEELTGGYRLAGGLLLDELVRLLEIEPIESEADTVSGYLMERLGRIAEKGDQVEVEGYNLVVEDMDRLRIVSVKVEALSGRSDKKS